MGKRKRRGLSYIQPERDQFRRPDQCRRHDKGETEDGGLTMTIAARLARGPPSKDEASNTSPVADANEAVSSATVVVVAVSFIQFG